MEREQCVLVRSKPSELDRRLLRGSVKQRRGGGEEGGGQCPLLSSSTTVGPPIAAAPAPVERKRLLVQGYLTYKKTHPPRTLQ